MAKSIRIPADSTYSQDRTSTGAGKDPWRACQAQIFETTKFRTGDGVQSMTLLKAYYKSLLAAAQSGNVRATREVNFLVQHLDQQDLLAQPRTRIAGSIDMEQRIEEQKGVARVANTFIAVSFLVLRSELIAHFEKAHGRTPDFAIGAPYYVDPRTVEECFGKILKIIRKKRGNDPGVGYCKPPIRTRWTEGQSGNPSGKRRSQEEDGWQSFRDCLFQHVTVLKEGQKTKLTSAAVICRRLFEAAIKGDAPARREVRSLLTELDRRGLMVPPAPRPRRRRSRPLERDARGTAVIRLAGTLTRLCVKEDMSEAFRQVYGPDPNFYETIARERQAALAELASLNLTKGEEH